MLKKSIIGVFLILVTPLSVVPAARATSIYDATVTATNNLFSSCYADTTTKDMTDDWQAYITQKASYNGVDIINGSSNTDRSNFIDAFNTAMDSGSGFGVSQSLDGSLHDFGSVRIYVTSGTPVFFDTGTQKQLRTIGAPVYMATIQCVSSTSVAVYFNNAGTIREFATDGTLGTGTWMKPYVWAGSSISYPSGYNGQYVPDSSSVDIDGDGLSGVDESTQGTLNTKRDTDVDGLSDFVESQWNLNRNEIFCGISCAYPDPATKDLYVENDWINDGIRDYKPSSTQINDIIGTYESQGIIAHFDTGQYGGGNQISLNDPLVFAPSDNELDFYDVKNGTSTVSTEFSPTRKNIWHYMITSPNFMQTDTIVGTTGASYAGDDDSIVSIESVEGANPINLDIAISGTILHELGHNLCLSSETSQYYPDQPPECIYSEIDKPLNQSPSTDYESVMNYLFQLNTKNYSHGSNGAPDDHDDWSAVNLGIGDFTQSVFEWNNSSQYFRGNSNKPSRQDMIDNIQG